MRKTALPQLFLRLFGVVSAAFGQTTYYQNQVYQFRDSTLGYFALYQTFYTAPDGSELELRDIVAYPNFDCASGGGNQGYVDFTTSDGTQPPCAIITSKPALGPTISTTTYDSGGRPHVCTGPSSEHVEFSNGTFPRSYSGTYDANYTFVWKTYCFTRTLSSEVTLTLQ
jgi:hypothetical protein